ncbi:hypothetical protein K502DRAFT_288278 [Neoconidiobolus thromboides FSU 785]|nr:hypothetical protein K502DRAFT_288278 [Neoconidiobolus thromboides FSU 785]
MVRTSLPPNQVAFRVPLKTSKLDIRDYLYNLYQVKAVDVRTMIYQGTMTRNRATRRRTRNASTKKAIVTLENEFQYPEPPNMEDFGGSQTKLAMDKVKSKLKGWRIRQNLSAVSKSVSESKST